MEPLRTPLESGSLKYIPELPEPPHEELLSAPRGPRLSKKNRIIIALVAVFIAVVGYWRLISAPAGPVPGTIVSIPRGEGLSGATADLASAKAIRSPFAFKSLVVLFGGAKGAQAGDYYFSTPENAVVVAWRLTHSMYELQALKVTIPEGLNSKEIADVFAKEARLTDFDKAEFLRIAAPYEGYLFPDTYLFLPNVTARGIVDAMLANYQKRIAALEPDIRAFGRPISEVIKMASIVEEEARTTETRETIAGILWKRFEEGMPLQVDSAFVFVNGKKDSRLLSTADLAISSPFNTYVNKGLPPTPISNPGLDSIRAAVHPIATKYYYYLSDKDGNMHYAVTLDQHVANKAKYLGY